VDSGSQHMPIVWIRQLYTFDNLLLVSHVECLGFSLQFGEKGVRALLLIFFVSLYILKINPFVCTDTMKWEFAFIKQFDQIWPYRYENTLWRISTGVWHRIKTLHYRATGVAPGHLSRDRQ